MIEIRELSHGFNGRAVLSDITLTLSERRIAIIGDNGSGKSTLARMLNGLLVPERGEVLVDGVSARRKPRQVRALVGHIFQNPEHQIVMPTVEEDLAFGLENMNLPGKEIERRVSEILGRHALTHLRNQPAHLLSGGEKKLLSILSVVIMHPRYIIFDEPMTSLDLRNRARISEVIAGLDQNVITITHDLELIADYDRALLLENGRIAADGPPAAVCRAYVEKTAR